MEGRNINEEMLIHEVSRRRSLWDQTSFEYKNRSLKLEEWGTVAQEVNATVEEVKKRWKILKDTFNREVHTMARNNKASDWAHFEQMSFLLKGLNNLLLPSAYLSQTSINTTASDIDFPELSTQASEDDDPPSSSRKRMKYHHPQSNKTSGVFSSVPSFQSNSTSGVFSSGPSFQSTPMLEWNKESAGNRAEFADEDYYFLMSLLPTFNKMSERNKMQLKIKMMQAVFDGAFGDSCNDLNRNGKNSSVGVNGSNSISSGS